MPTRNATLSQGLARALMSVEAALASLPAPGMIIGGVAVILHGVPRVTRDIDATVDASQMDINALLEHLAKHDITPRIEDVTEFAAANQVVLLRHRKSGVDVDLSLAWLPFEMEALAARQNVSRGGLHAQIARPEDLVIYKAIAWRPQDQQDVERLLQLYAAQINVARVLSVVSEFAEAMEEPERVGALKSLIDTVVR